MGTYAITGAASGICLVTRRLLEADGHSIICIDLRDTEVIADLSTTAGRAHMVEEVTALSGGHLDGIVAGAGVLGGQDNTPTVIAVNYFGALATLDGLRPLLVDGTAVAIASVAATTSPINSRKVLALCEAGDEEAALASTAHPLAAYAATKLALGRAVRRRAVSAEWLGSGHRLNAIAPGLVVTPMTEANIEQWEAAQPTRAGRPEELAAPIAWLLSPAASFCVGTLLTVDGGAEAMMRGEDWPSAAS